MTISKCFWLWGLFSDKDTYFLDEIKAKIQNKLKSPSFETHLTLTGPYLTTDNIFLNKLKTFAKSNSMITLNIDGYGFKQEKFKSFYISIKNSSGLKKLRKKIYKLENFDLRNNYVPHISMSYGVHKKLDKEELIAKLPELNQSIRISRIALVEVDKDISLWKTKEIFDLN